MARFNKKNDNAMSKGFETDPNSHNLIAAGTNINGDIETDGNIRVDGTLEGTLRSKGKVVLGESGKIEGEVYCANANVSGEVKGKITVTEVLTLKNTAKINGDVFPGKLEVEAGAIITGTCSMGGVIKDLKGLEESKSSSEKEKTA